LRALVEEAGWIAVFVSQQFSARRIPRRLRHTGQLHRPGVREPRMAARVREPHRVLRRDLAESLVQRKAFDVRRRRMRPLLLMPAAAEDPGARFRLLDCLANRADDVVPVLGRGELEVSGGLTDTGEMRVGVDEAGNSKRPLEVDDTGVRPTCGWIS